MYPACMVHDGQHRHKKSGRGGTQILRAHWADEFSLAAFSPTAVCIQCQVVILIVHLQLGDHDAW